MQTPLILETCLILLRPYTLEACLKMDIPPLTRETGQLWPQTGLIKVIPLGVSRWFLFERISLSNTWGGAFHAAIYFGLWTRSVAPLLCNAQAGRRWHELLGPAHQGTGAFHECEGTFGMVDTSKLVGGQTSRMCIVFTKGSPSQTHMIHISCVLTYSIPTKSDDIQSGGRCETQQT